MDWKEQLTNLQQAEEFEKAISFMQKIIDENPDDVDRYIFMLYLLADLIMEPHKRMVNNQGIEHYWNKEYRDMGKKYFHEGYAKFAQQLDKRVRCDFLYYVGLIAVFGAQVFAIPEEQANSMIQSAQQECPEYPLYHLGEPKNTVLAKQLLDPHSQIRKILATKGALGQYIVDINESWAHMTLQGY